MAINNAGSAFSNPWWSAQKIYKEPQWTLPKTGFDMSTGAGLELPSVEDGFYADPSGRKTFSGKPLPYFAKNMFQRGINLSGESSEEGTAAILNWDAQFSGKPLYEWAAMDPSKVDFAALDPDLAKLPADIQQAIRDDWDNYLLGLAGGLNLGGPSGRGDLWEYIPHGYEPVTAGKHGDPLRTHGEYSWRSLNGAQYLPGIGLILPSKNYRAGDTTFMDKLAPALILGAVGMGIGQMAGLGVGAASGGAGGAAAGGGAGGAGALAAEGATGLASLPAAGTWAQTAIPAVGAGAGSWTLPASLAGIEGATTVAGGFTMADAIRNGMQNLPVDIGDGLTSLVPDGAYDTPLPDTTQWQPPNYPGRKSFLESIKELIKPTPTGLGGGGSGGNGGGMNFSDWLNLGGTVAGIGTSIWSGNKQADAASDAAKLQAAGQAAALEELKRQFDLSRADQMPWLTAGKDSLAQLSALMAPGGALTRKFGAADFEADPGYQFQLAEGEQAANRAAAARGGYNSGRTLKELMRYGQGLASTTYQDAYNRYNTDQSNLYNRLAGIAGTGQTAATTLGNAGANYAANVGNTLTGGANAQAASRIAGANARTSGYMGAANAITGGINNYQQSQLLSQLLRKYGA